MKSFIITMLLSAAVSIPSAAQGLTLDDCRRLAHDNFPAVKRYDLIEKTRGYDVDNVLKSWLPQVSVTAGATVFTDIAKDNVPLDMKNWVASAAVSVSQNIYDGGQTAAKRSLVTAQSEVEKKGNDVTMYAINDRVEAVFFGILALDERLKQAVLLREDLTIHSNMIQSMMQGGVANQSDLDAVRVELVKVDQQQTALETQRDAYLRVLECLLGQKVTLPLQRPVSLAAQYESPQTTDSRPELAFYASQNALLDAQRRMLDTRLRPVVSLFGMGMAHTDVTEMMRSGMLMGGLSLKWNIGALYTRRNDIRKLDAQRGINDMQRDIFLYNNRIQNRESDGAIVSLRKQIGQDEEIVTLETKLRKATELKVEQGTESVSELLRRTNAVSRARQQKALHEILLLQETYKKRTLNNN